MSPPHNIDKMATAPATRPAVHAAPHAAVFWGVDIQHDFMHPDGKLYIPGAEKIAPNIHRLVQAARQHAILLVSSADAHRLDDPELREWPPHCLKDTPGASLIPEASASRRLVIPNRKEFTFPNDIGTYPQIVLQKNTLDVFDNPHTDRLLDRLRSAAPPHHDVEFIVFGVATDYCVHCTAEGLLRRGCQIILVTDAIQSFDPAKGQLILDDLQARGAKLLSTEEVLALRLHPATFL